MQGVVPQTLNAKDTFPWNFKQQIWFSSQKKYWKIDGVGWLFSESHIQQGDHGLWLLPSTASCVAGSMALDEEASSSSVLFLFGTQLVKSFCICKYFLFPLSPLSPYRDRGGIVFPMGILAWEEYVFCFHIQCSLSLLLGEKVKMVFRRGSQNVNSKWRFNYFYFLTNLCIFPWFLFSWMFSCWQFETLFFYG